MFPAPSIQSKLFLFIMSLTGLSAGSAPCFAGNFIVDFSSNQTNGGFMIDGDDSLTITPSGSISVALGASAGIVSTVGYNVITNYGAVQIKGKTYMGYGIMYRHTLRLKTRDLS
jgi:hypothetical protein